jgi:hypothetical protein
MVAPSDDELDGNGGIDGNGDRDGGLDGKDNGVGD